MKEEINIQDLLKFAKQYYSIGTTFKCLDGNISECDIEPKVITNKYNDLVIVATKDCDAVYENGLWSPIIELPNNLKPETIKLLREYFSEV